MTAPAQESFADDPLARLREATATAWSQIAAKTETMRAEATSIKTINSGGKKTVLTHGLTYRRNGSQQSLEVRNLTENGGHSDRVFAINPRYGFQLTSASNQASAGGWVIRDASPNYGISANLPAVIDEMTHSVFSVPGEIATLPLDMLINSEGLTLVRSTRQNGMTNRPETVSIEFDYTPTSEDLKQWSVEGFGQATPPAMSGTMTLVPNWNYALTNYSVTARPNVIGRGKSPPVRISASIDYRSRNIATIPSRVEQTISSDGMTRKVKCDIAEVALDGVDDSEFTLTHYGLPEVAVEPVRLSTGWKLILLSNAIFAIGLLVLLSNRFYSKSKGGHPPN